jgi:hypothetical protein
MKVSCALATAALFVLSVVPVRAQTIYPTPWCRVYDDTAFIQIPGQCGTVVPFYPRKLFVRSPRQPSYHHYRYYY